MIQSLEMRLLLADMSIGGTSGNDIIAIRQTNTSPTAATIEVSNGGSSAITVKIGTSTASIAKATKKTYTSIGKITLVDLGAGDDKFTADKSVKIPMTVAGGDGKDTITGGSGADVLDGDKETTGAFGDSIKGGAGNDSIFGFGGADFLFGEDGADSIRGGFGNDYLHGGMGQDRLFGQGDNDEHIVDDGFVDNVDGGTGIDTWNPTALADSNGRLTRLQDVGVQLEKFAVGSGLNNPDGFNFSIEGTSGPDVIDAKMEGTTLVVTVNGVVRRYTAAERNAVIRAIVASFDPESAGDAEEQNDVQIHGNGGNDTLTGGAGIRALTGGDGNDRLISKGANGLYGGAGNDFLQGWTGSGTDLSGDERFLSVDNEPTDEQPAGNDTIIGGPFRDYIVAGAGADVIRPSSSLVEFEGLNQEPIFFASNDTARDTIDYADRTVPLKMTFSANGRELSVTSNNGLAVTIGMTVPASVIGGKANDSIFGSDQADIVNGGGGNDTIKGNAGNDTITGGAGNDSIDAGAGNDRIFNADGVKDIVIGGAGTDTASKAATDLDLISTVEVLV